MGRQVEEAIASYMLREEVPPATGVAAAGEAGVPPDLQQQVNRYFGVEKEVQK